MPSGVISDSARHVNSQVHNHSDSGRASVRAVAPSSSAATLSHQTSIREATRLLCGDQREVKINAIVGTRISGMLLKWVNYGKGWRRRWFVLQDGVLSIYKVHGHDKVVVGQDAEEGWRVIGEKSLRRISGHNNGSSPLQRKPVAEVHLKVSSVHECKSDDKRFSIFTGTKRLHLRAGTREDRLAWMNALQATKDMFPRTSNCDFVAPLDNVVVSTERLRQRLLEEGLSEATIHDSEQIMRSEFVALQNQIVQLDQKNWLLMETLQQLEVNVMTIRKRHANQNRDSSSVSSEKNSAHSSAFHSPQN